MTDEQLFKFAVGAFVAHRLRPDKAFMIVERILQDCHGGRQLKYLLRDSIPFSGRDAGLVDVTEAELVLFQGTWCCPSRTTRACAAARRTSPRPAGAAIARTRRGADASA